MQRLVVIPPDEIVIAERKKVSVETNKPPRQITKTSIMKMMIPTLILMNSEKYWANKSVPPVLVSKRSIRPMPKPMNTPPVNELRIGENFIGT